MPVEPGWSSVRCAIDPAHPTAAGHFPGNPIIPGAVLLDLVVRAMGEANAAPLHQGTLRSAKFLRPVRPGDDIEIRWGASGARALKFEVRAAQGEIVLMGVLNRDTEAP